MRRARAVVVAVVAVVVVLAVVVQRRSVLFDRQSCACAFSGLYL